MAEQAPGQSDAFSWASPPVKELLLRDPAAILKDRGLNVPPDMPLPIIHEFVRVVSLLWLDGAVVPLDRFAIDPSDEGLLFGRGAWESTRTIGGRPWLWPYHLERLRRTAEVLRIDLAPERLPDEQQVADYVGSLTTQDVIVRLNVTAGRPGKVGLVWMSAAPMPMTPPPVRLRACLSPVQKGQAYLILKTFHYAARLRLGQEAGQSGFDTALMVDAEGHLLEAAHANIFARLPEGWATPPAEAVCCPARCGGICWSTRRSRCGRRRSRMHVWATSGRRSSPAATSGSCRWCASTATTTLSAPRRQTSSAGWSRHAGQGSRTDSATEGAFPDSSRASRGMRLAITFTIPDGMSVRVTPSVSPRLTQRLHAAY
jgi:hypothetical protein